MSRSQQQPPAVRAPFLRRWLRRSRRPARLMARMWALVLVLAVVTALVSWRVGIAPRDPGGTLLRGRLVEALRLLAVLAVADVLWRTVRRGRGGWNVRGLAGTVRRRWSPERVLLALGGLLAYHVVYLCYRNLKSWNALRPLRDDALLALDRWAFWGHDPGVLLHDLLGQGRSATVLMVAYAGFTPLVKVFVVSSLTLTRRMHDGYLFLTAAIWVWILGVVSYYLLPSLGPFASAPGDFTGLRDTEIAGAQGRLLARRADFLAHPGASDTFASIGAFASLHVAFTAVVVLLLLRHRQRVLTAIAGLYLVLVVLATVYFGWHYVSDVLAGLLIAVVSARLARATVGQRVPSTDDV